MSENENRILDFMKTIEMLKQRNERLELLFDEDIETILKFPEGFVRCKEQVRFVMYDLSEYFKNKNIFNDDPKHSLVNDLIKNIRCVENDKDIFQHMISEVRWEFHFDKKDSDNLRNHTEKDDAIFVKDVLICRAFGREK
jgi:hypothetical protein